MGLFWIILIGPMYSWELLEAKLSLGSEERARKRYDQVAAERFSASPWAVTTERHQSRDEGCFRKARMTVDQFLGIWTKKEGLHSYNHMELSSTENPENPKCPLSLKTSSLDSRLARVLTPAFGDAKQSIRWSQSGLPAVETVNNRRVMLWIITLVVVY